MKKCTQTNSFWENSFGCLDGDVTCIPNKKRIYKTFCEKSNILTEYE